MKKIALAILILALPSIMLNAEDHSYNAVPQNVPAKDTKRVLWLGNSFTFYFDCYNMLVEIAGSQGHAIKMKKSCVGGYTFECHLNDPVSIKAVNAWDSPYDFVILQNQSQANAAYGRDPKRFRQIMPDARTLVSKIRTFSPDAVIFFEATWAYPGNNCGGFSSLENFDAMMDKGTSAIAKATGCIVSPIGKAFAISRAERPDIDLLGPDRKHQSIYGSYLKTCVDYLMIYGGTFDANVSNCSLEPEKAAYLRSVALRAVK